MTCVPFSSHFHPYGPPTTAMLPCLPQLLNDGQPHREHLPASLHLTAFHSLCLTNCYPVCITPPTSCCKSPTPPPKKKPSQRNHNSINRNTSYMPRLGRSSSILTYSPTIRPLVSCSFFRPHGSGLSWLLLHSSVLSLSPLILFPSLFAPTLETPVSPFPSSA